MSQVENFQPQFSLSQLAQSNYCRFVAVRLYHRELPIEIYLALIVAAKVISKRLGILFKQSSTVIRDMMILLIWYLNKLNVSTKNDSGMVSMPASIQIKYMIDI